MSIKNFDFQIEADFFDQKPTGLEEIETLLHPSRFDTQQLLTDHQVDKINFQSLKHAYFTNKL